MSSEPTTKRRKLEDGAEEATGVAHSAPVIDQHDLAKAKMIVNALPQERLTELLTKCAETMPGITALIEEAASGDASLKKLFVYNLSPTTTSESLQAFYSKYGPVKECKVIDGKNYGFVNFETVNASYSALHAVGGQELDGVTISAKLADPPKVAAAPSSSYGGHGVGGGYSARSSGYGGGAPSTGGYSGGASAGGYGGGASAGGSARAPDTEELKARKLFIRGIAWEGTKESISHAYSQFGRVENVFVAMDRNTGKTKGYAFVTMSTAQEAQNALANPMIELEGRRVTASLASEGANRKAGGATQSYYNNSGYGGGAAAGGYGGGAAAGGYGGAAAAGGYGGGASAGGYGGGAAAGGYGGGAAAGGYGGYNAPAAGGYGAAPAAGGYGAAPAAGGYGASAGYGASRGY